ncbi:MAG: PKD domain-containing protein, partial [Planctomycetota bacterium]
NDRLRHDMWDDVYRDGNLLFGTSSHPKCDGLTNALIDAYLRRTTTFRKLYYEKVAAGLRHYYDPAILKPKAERLRTKIREFALQDRQLWPSYGRNSNFELNYDALLKWIDQRYAHLKSKLEALNVEVGPALNAHFEPSLRTGSTPLKVSFANLSVGSISKQTWDFGDGNTSSEKSPTHTYKTPGRYDVTLTVEDAHGPHRWTLRDAVVIPAPTP